MSDDGPATTVEVLCLENKTPRSYFKIQKKYFGYQALAFGLLPNACPRQTTFGYRLSVARLTVSRLTHQIPSSAARPYGVLLELCKLARLLGDVRRSTRGSDSISFAPSQLCRHRGLTASIR